MADRLGLVGGSSAGIGRAIAEGLLQKGLDVVLTARGEERLQACAGELRKKHPGRTVHAFSADSSDEASIKRLIASVRNVGSPDVLVLNTGGPKAGTFETLVEADWDVSYRQLFKSQLLLLSAFLPEMKRKKWGRVIGVSSTIALEPTPAMILSASFRAALINALKALSVELAQDGITFNTVCPGAVMTQRLTSLITEQAKKAGKSADEAVRNAEATIPMRRIASPEEFAQVAVFLASDEARYVTGTVIPVDGGLVKSSF